MERSEDVLMAESLGPSRVNGLRPPSEMVAPLPCLDGCVVH
jgi:hypothetical protein